jgi:uncharacterized protein YcaQ
LADHGTVLVGGAQHGRVRAPGTVMTSTAAFSNHRRVRTARWSPNTVVDASTYRNSNHLPVRTRQWLEKREVDARSRGDVGTETYGGGVATHTLTREQARRIAVRAALLDANPRDEALLDASRPDDLVGMIGALGMLRVELTTTVAPAADHVAWSRLGSSYRPSDLERALASGQLFERGWMLHPMSDLGLYLAGMRTWADRTGARGWMDDNADFARSILDRVADDGPQTSREIPDEAVAPWPSTGWNNNRNVTQMLDCLHMTGELAVVGRVGRFRVWDLAERVFRPVPEVPGDDARRIRSERLLAACGIMRDSIAVSPTELHGVVTVGEPATIESVPGRWRVDPGQLDRPFEGRTALLSPFDRLMTDPQRVARLFEFDYALEMYKPASRRVWGQFALPILHGDRLVGKVDARSDRLAGRFVVNAVHEDVPFSRDIRTAVDEQIRSFASWLRLEVQRGH